MYWNSFLAFYIIFLSFDNPLTPEDVDDSATNPMSTPSESVMAMFLMSMTNFGEYYNAFSRTEHEYEAKVKLFATKTNFYSFYIVFRFFLLYLWQL